MIMELLFIIYEILQGKETLVWKQGKDLNRFIKDNITMLIYKQYVSVCEKSYNKTEIAELYLIKTFSHFQPSIEFIS